MASASIARLVVGVSGGADSALALLGAASALDRMGLARENLVAVVMPGFGSTDDSQKRAVELAKAVDASVRVVDRHAVQDRTSRGDIFCKETLDNL